MVSSLGGVNFSECIELYTSFTVCKSYSNTIDLNRNSKDIWGIKEIISSLERQIACVQGQIWKKEEENYSFGHSRGPRKEVIGWSCLCDWQAVFISHSASKIQCFPSPAHESCSRSLWGHGSLLVERHGKSLQKMSNVRHQAFLLVQGVIL